MEMAGKGEDRRCLEGSVLGTLLMPQALQTQKGASPPPVEDLRSIP